MAELKEKLSSTQQSELDRIYSGLEQRWQASRDDLEAQKKSVPQSLMIQ